MHVPVFNLPWVGNSESLASPRLQCFRFQAAWNQEVKKLQQILQSRRKDHFIKGKKEGQFFSCIPAYFPLCTVCCPAGRVIGHCGKGLQFKN